MEKIRCPHCGVYVEPAEGGGPFFCSSCRQIVDPKARRAGVSAYGDSPHAAPPEPAPVASKQPIIRHGVAAGSTVGVGYALALLTGAGVGYGLGWLANNHVYLPLVGSALGGWLISRALALGSGGGTPDRGPMGFLLLAVACVGALAIWTFVDFQTERDRETDHWRRVFGPFGVQSAMRSVEVLAERDVEKKGEVVIVENGRTVRLDEERQRAELAVAAGVASTDPFDVHLLATSGRTGFEGFVLDRAKAGRVLRLRPDDKGWVLGGGAAVALAAAELLTLLVFAFHRRD
jgi:hypothetical protein